MLILCFARQANIALLGALIACETYADRRLHPLARRRFITKRPDFVAIRARKPCLRLRTRLEG